MSVLRLQPLGVRVQTSSPAPIKYKAKKSEKSGFFVVLKII
ncbi:MAG: hypothetical protein U9Q66_04205 [Patescibacteria group bacterium]|nr:hypothetical protein [Patescibacteria group bacterium]